MIVHYTDDVHICRHTSPMFASVSVRIRVAKILFKRSDISDNFENNLLLSFISIAIFIYFHASGDFCRLLLTFANSLDPDQARQNVGFDLISTRLYAKKNHFENGIFEKHQQTSKHETQLPSMQRVKVYN